MSWLQESSTYQAIIAEGRAQGEARGRVEQTHRLVLELGAEKFGAPDQQTRATLDAIDELELLERLARRVLTASSWNDLLTIAPDH